MQYRTLVLDGKMRSGHVSIQKLHSAQEIYQLFDEWPSDCAHLFVYLQLL